MAEVDTEQIRQKLQSGEIKITESSTVIQEGGLNQNTIYQIKHGWSINYANQCDVEWQTFYIQIFELLNKPTYSREQKEEILNSFSAQDKHWDWYQKSCAYSNDNYHWFYMIAEEKPQGVCLIYHPQQSILTNNQIFYLEYLAVAPWNRDNKIFKKKFRGLGSILLKCAMSYAIQTLQLKPGFSLHSLEQAEGYYQHIGMTAISTEDKQDLKFFEMDPITAQTMVSTA